MFIITIRTESNEDLDAIKEVLEEASEEGQINEPFEFKVEDA